MVVIVYEHCKTAASGRFVDPGRSRSASEGHSGCLGWRVIRIERIEDDLDFTLSKSEKERV